MVSDHSSIICSPRLRQDFVVLYQRKDRRREGGDGHSDISSTSMVTFGSLFKILALASALILSVRGHTQIVERPRGVLARRQGWQGLGRPLPPMTTRSIPTNCTHHALSSAEPLASSSPGAYQRSGQRLNNCRPGAMLPSEAGQRLHQLFAWHGSRDDKDLPF